MFRLIFRLISASIALALTALFVKNFVIDGLTALVMAVIVISLIDFILEKVFDMQVKPIGRGISGFILSVAIFYGIQYVVDGYSITIGAAILAALVYAVISFIIPGKGFFEGKKNKK
jgi:uncharacterized membrane protein YvlD (DUF360 family)